MKKRFLLLMATIILASYSLRAQVSINTDGNDPDGSAMLDVKSNEKGMLVPRMTTQQRIDINTPATGLLVFDITTGSFWFHNNEWTDLSASDGAWTVNGDNISSPNTGNVGIGTTNPQSLLHLWGNGSYGTGSRLTFGDDLSLGGTRAYIAEWGWQTDTDSDILELSGNRGIKFTSGSSSLFTEMEITQNHNVGIGTVNGPEPSAKLDVESTTQGFLPPRMTAAQGNAISSPATGLLIYQTDETAGYYYNSGTTSAPVWTRLATGDIDGSETKVTAGTNVTVTGSGTTASPYVINASGPALSIGDTHEGGIIFYLDASGNHGLVCAASDQSAGITWWIWTYDDTYAYGNGIGAGDGNAYAIRRWQGTCSGCFAAELCYYLNLNAKTDWYLPSKYELNLMYENVGPGNALGLGNIGGFVLSTYWSSTEYNNVYAWAHDFTGYQSYAGKHGTYRVRAIRVF